MVAYVHWQSVPSMLGRLVRLDPDNRAISIMPVHDKVQRLSTSRVVHPAIGVTNRRIGGPRPASFAGPRGPRENERPQIPDGILKLQRMWHVAVNNHANWEIEMLECVVCLVPADTTCPLCLRSYHAGCLTQSVDAPRFQEVVGSSKRPAAARHSPDEIGLFPYVCCNSRPVDKLHIFGSETG